MSEGEEENETFLTDSRTTGVSKGWKSSGFRWKSTFLIVPVVNLEINLNLGEILCLCIYTLRPGAADALHSMIQP